MRYAKVSSDIIRLSGKCLLLFCALALLAACAGKSPPAPVTTLEIRKQQIAQQQRAPLSGQQYIVQRGDTLYAIAFRSGQDYRTLAARNNIRAPYVIHPGQVIRLQGNVASAAPSAQNRSTTARTATPNPPKAVASSSQKGYGQVTQEPRQPSLPAPVTGRVSWQWPVRGPLLARFSTAENGIKGIQIGGAAGARINAAADGQVVYAGNALRGYGNLIIIKHNDDFLSAYAHNRRILVKERQEVKAGQQIAEMGDTDAASIRLHFEIRFRGTSVDPIRYLPK